MFEDEEVEEEEETGLRGLLLLLKDAFRIGFKEDVVAAVAAATAAAAVVSLIVQLLRCNGWLSFF